MGPPRLGVELPFAVALAMAATLTAVAALVTGRGKGGSALGLALGVAAMFAPMSTGLDLPLLRVIVALMGLLCLLRVIDLMRGATRLETPWRRVWFATTPFDVRQTSPAKPALDLWILWRVVAYGLLATVTGWSVVHVAPRLGAGATAARWILGGAFIYTTVDAVVSTMRLGYRAAGYQTPDFHRAPVLSRTLQEFWGERWNRPVHEWLQRHCFRPLARRRHVALGVLAAFVASTAIHVWLALVAVEIGLALVMGAFFIAQGVLLLAERALRVARWPSGLARAWTLGCFALTGPLFVEPMLAIMQM